MMRPVRTGPNGRAIQRAVTSMVLVVASLIVLAGCGGGESVGTTKAGKFPMTVSSCGREVTIERPPKRVLTERETSTTVAAAGAADRIVARSGEGDYPLGRYEDQLSKVPQITPNSADPPSREVVLGHGVDLVVAGHITSQYVDDLTAVGINVLVPSWFCNQVSGSTAPVGYDDIYRTLETYSRVFDTEDIARRTITDLRQRVATVQQQFRGTSPRTAADLFVAPDQLYLYGEPSLNNAVMTTLGLTNVFADSKQRSAEVGTEPLLARNPEVILLNFGSDYGTSNGADVVRAFRGMPAIDQLTAVREQRVITLNSSYLNSGPLAVDGLEILARQLKELT